MDLFQLDYKEVDRIYGDISELATHLGQLDTLETDHLAKKTATKWCVACFQCRFGETEKRKTALTSI